MENWFSEDFAPEKAGWKQGQAPFGRFGDKLDRRRSVAMAPCGCKRCKTLGERGSITSRTFDIPAVKEGHAYRLILGGAGCDRSGEGFAIYVKANSHSV